MPRGHQEWSKAQGYDTDYFAEQARKAGPATEWAMGRLLVPADFDRIDELNEPGLFRLERGEHIGYIWINKGQVREVWALQN